MGEIGRRMPVEKPTVVKESPVPGEPAGRPSLPAPGGVPPSAAPRWLAALLWTAGCAALALGFIGIFLPLLPTTPLVLLAAACFVRASPRAYRWLLRNRTFGPIIAQWRADRTVPRGAKWTGIVLVFLAFAATALLVPNCIYGYVTLGLLGGGMIVFLASLSTQRAPRAEPPAEG